QTRNEAKAQLDKYERAFRVLEHQRVELLAGGHPQDALAETRQAREAAIQVMEQAASASGQARDTLTQLEPIIASLRSHRFEDRCPPCARPFTAEEAEITLAALDDRVDALRDKTARLDGQRQQAQRRAAAVEKTQREAEQRLAEFNTIDGR